VTSTVQLLPTLILEGHAFASLKSAALGPPKWKLKILSGALPGLVSVNVFGGLVLSTGSGPNSKLPGKMAIVLCENKATKLLSISVHASRSDVPSPLKSPGRIRYG